MPSDHIPDQKPPKPKPKPKQRPRMALTRNLKFPSEYALLMNGELAGWALNEELAPKFVGRWRDEVFKVEPATPLDLEIGTGNGYHFAHLAKKHPERALIGIELKFKPLVQSIRRALKSGAKMARIVRYDANRIDDLFAEDELNNVYVHFPDPWLKKRQWKHRLIQDDFLEMLYARMRPGGRLEFKTDSVDYFDWASERFANSPFEITRATRDLHRSEWREENFITHFESLFLQQGLPIHYARLEKPLPDLLRRPHRVVTG